MSQTSPTRRASRSVNPSMIAVDRIVEEQRTSHPARPSRKPVVLLSDVRRETDEALLARLAPFGLTLDRTVFPFAASPFLSAEHWARSVVGNPDSPPPYDPPLLDCWHALACLWERWLPDTPSFEMFDDSMQLGYRMVYDDDRPADACDQWLSTWSAFLGLSERGGFSSIDAFDTAFLGTQAVFNWVQDLEMELHNAGLRDPRFRGERIRFARDYLERYAHEHPQITAGMKGALGEALAETGELEASLAMFREWTQGEPRSAHAWMYWSHLYSTGPKALRDPARAEELLETGLAVPEIDDREQLVRALADVYSDQGKVHEAESLLASFVQRREPDAPPEPPPATLQRVGTKIGRNDPCPCGSGKKYKKCCAPA